MGNSRQEAGELSPAYFFSGGLMSAEQWIAMGRQLLQGLGIWQIAQAAVYIFLAISGFFYIMGRPGE